MEYCDCVHAHTNCMQWQRRNVGRVKTESLKWSHQNSVLHIIIKSIAHKLCFSLLWPIIISIFLTVHCIGFILRSFVVIFTLCLWLKKERKCVYSDQLVLCLWQLNRPPDDYDITDHIEDDRVIDRLIIMNVSTVHCNAACTNESEMTGIK